MDVGQYQNGKMKRKRKDADKTKDGEGVLSEIKVDEQRDPAAIVSMKSQL